MKDRTDDSQPNPWPGFTKETGGQVVVERTGWFIFKSTESKLVIPMGKHTMTVSDWNGNAPWRESVTIVGAGGEGDYSTTCMTVPYLSPKALTFRVYKNRGRSWFAKLFGAQDVKTDSVFDNDLTINNKGRDIELIEQLFSDSELREMISRCLGRQHASEYIFRKSRFYYFRASNHGWAWIESKIVKHIGDETLNELRLVYQGELEDTELLLSFHQLLTKTMESLSAIGCVSESPIYE